MRETKVAATELLDSLEKKVGSSSLIGHYADIQRRLQATKAEKKRVLASEAIKDPKAYAVRKVRTSTYVSHLFNFMLVEVHVTIPYTLIILLQFYSDTAYTVS